MDIRLGHAFIVHLEGLELRVVLLLPFVDVPQCEGDFVACRIGPGGRLILEGDGHSLHFEDHHRNFSAVRGV